MGRRSLGRPKDPPAARPRTQARTHARIRVMPPATRDAGLYSIAEDTLSIIAGMLEAQDRWAPWSGCCHRRPCTRDLLSAPFRAG